MARKIHAEIRRAVLDAWEHGIGWRSPLTRSMYGAYGRRYEVTSDQTGVSVLVWGHQVARLSCAWEGGRHVVRLYDGGYPSAMTRDALQAVADALGLCVGFCKRGNQIICTKDGLSFPVLFEGVSFLWG